MPCENAAQSDDYFEFIGEYSGVVDYEKKNLTPNVSQSSIKDLQSHTSRKMDGHQSTDKTAHTTRSQDVLA